MGSEEGKRIASEFFARFNDNDIDGALSMLADDVNWWVAGKPESLPAAGDHNKEQITGLLHNMAGGLKDGLKMTVKTLIAEGDRVALEAESHGELKNGRIYNNEYHFLLTIREGKIREVKEYLDTQHVFGIWFEP
jgi:ketosteroid isomerase-like protein